MLPFFPLRRLSHRLSALLIAGTVAGASLVAPAPARAEGKIRIAEQSGIVYLLLNVAQDQKLIEKHGKEKGLDVQVEWIQLSGGASVNDALLSGSVDNAGAGIGPLLTLWVRTLGKQNVKGVASLGRRNKAVFISGSPSPCLPAGRGWQPA